MNGELFIRHHKSSILMMIDSDHRPMIVKVHRNPEVGALMYKKHWFKSVIGQGWRGDVIEQLIYFPIHLQRCRRYILEWKKTNSSSAAKYISSLTSQIDDAHTDITISEHKIQQMKTKLILEYKEEEEYWFLKSRFQWKKYWKYNSFSLNLPRENIRSPYASSCVGQSRDNLQFTSPITAVAWSAKLVKSSCGQYLTIVLLCLILNHPFPLFRSYNFYVY